MGQKTHPYGFRLVYNKSWHSRWYAEHDYADLLHQDLELRSQLKKRLSRAGVSEIEIERAADRRRGLLVVALGIGGIGSLVEAGIDEFGLVDFGQGCLACTPPTETLCTIETNPVGDDVVIDWSANPVGTRAVVYQINGCGDQVKLATVEDNSFVHTNAMLSSASYSYRVTFVDACGVEQAFCGATDCP